MPALCESVHAQTFPPNVVLFVDGGSNDATVQRLREACERNRGWHVIDAGPATPGRGRNVGIQAADADWLALTDAGITLDPHWLDRLVRHVDADPSLEVVWGHYEPAPGGFFVTSAALAYVAPPGDVGCGPARVPSIASCLIRRDLWERVGGFPDLRAAEDRIFIERVEALGVRAAVAPEAVAWWQLAPTPAATFRRFRTYSRVNVRAGRQRDWHRGVARMYLAAAPFVGLGLVRSRRWLVVPALGSVARVARTTWRQRQGRSAVWALNPVRLAGVGFVLAITDAAMFTGWAEAVLARRAD